MNKSSNLISLWIGHLRRDFHRISLQRLCAVATMTALLGLPSARAQKEAGGLPPELAPLAAKYHADLAALTEARSKAVAALRQSYLAALGLAEQKATSERKPDELKAVTDEKEAVSAGRALPPLPPPLLPHELAPSRSYFQREAGRAGREYAAHAQQAAGDYLRVLAFYENKARMANQTDLLQQIAAEKLSLAGQNLAGPAAAPIIGRNLVINGDFALRKDDVRPENWDSGAPGSGFVATEQGMNFLRVVSRDRKETSFFENVERPAGAEELRVTARLRCRDLKVQGECGVIIAQRDGEDKFLVRDRVCILTSSSPGWKSLRGIVKIRPETRKLIIRCNVVNSVNTVDFADVRVEAR